MIKVKDIIISIIFVFIFLLLWEWVVDYRFVLPKPSAIIKTLFERPGRFLFHAKTTLIEMIAGFVLAFSLAFPLGWAMWHWKSACRILQPVFVVIQCIPMFVLAPIMVLWFGWGFLAIVVPTALMIFFPLTMNIFHGFDSVPKHTIEYFKANDATLWQIFTKLQLPFAKPYIFSGFRISAAIAGIGAVAGEWAGAQSGLGVLMLDSRRGADLETTFGALFVLVAMSMSLYGFILLIEAFFTKRKVRHIISAFLVVLVFSGCAHSEDKTKMLLDWLPNPNHVPLYAGIKKGFFKKRGIELELIKLNDPSDSVPYLTSGQADVALFYTAETITTNAQFPSLEPIAIVINRSLNGLIFRKEEGVEKPTDLNGKVIGYCVGTSRHLLDLILEKNHIQPCEMRNVSFDLVGSLAMSQVDAIYGAYWNIECEHLRSLGVDTNYFDATDLGILEHSDLIVVAKKGSKDQAFIDLFKEGLQESIDFSVSHPDVAFDIYLQENPDKSKKTIEWEKKAWFATYPLLTETQEINMEGWNRFAAQLLE